MSIQAAATTHAEENNKPVKPKDRVGTVNACEEEGEESIEMEDEELANHD